ncbi:MAG: AAA family ATPase, partial [Candidatus Poribacteria bacterium]|nr:AAA family ATPase [Candidatus Poribacteria bacterium]
MYSDQSSNHTKRVIQKLLKQTQQSSESDQNKHFSTSRARVLCITSGKGGAGKSVLTYNIGFHFAQKGCQVTILDADMGLGNIHSLSGTSLNYDLVDLIHGQMDLDDVILETDFGFSLISGGKSAALANLTYHDFRKLTNYLEPLKSTNDLILVDTASSLSLQTTAFLHTLNEIVVVVPPDPTAVSTTLTIIRSILQFNRSALIGLIINQVPKKRIAKEVFSEINRICILELNKKLIDYGQVRTDSNI